MLSIFGLSLYYVMNSNNKTLTQLEPVVSYPFLNTVQNCTKGVAAVA